MAKHSREDVARDGLGLYQPYATEQAHNREIRAALDTARAEVEAKGAEVRAAEADGLTGERAEESLWSAAAATAHRFAHPREAFDLIKGADRTAFAKVSAAIGKAKQERAEAERYAKWLEGQIAQSDARLVGLEEQAVEYLGREVARPLHEEAVAEIDAAIEAMLAAFQKEQELRSTVHDVFRRGKPADRRPAAAGRLARYIIALGSLSQVGDLGALETAVEAWRREARSEAGAARYKVRPATDRASLQARRIARQWA